MNNSLDGACPLCPLCQSHDFITNIGTRHHDHLKIVTDIPRKLSLHHISCRLIKRTVLFSDGDRHISNQLSSGPSK
jgi:hypothetical protein